jgi:hypothetical protein
VVSCVDRIVEELVLRCKHRPLCKLHKNVLEVRSNVSCMSDNDKELRSLVAHSDEENEYYTKLFPYRRWMIAAVLWVDTGISIGAHFCE